MENQNSSQNNKVLKKYAQEVQSDVLPPPRFGHTVNIISKTRIVIFGGAISTPNNQASYTMTSDLYLYNMAQNIWKKLDPAASYKPPHVRAAHASATVKIKKKQIGCRYLLMVLHRDRDTVTRWCIYIRI